MLVDSKLTEIMSRDQRSGVKDYLKSRNFRSEIKFAKSAFKSITDKLYTPKGGSIKIDIDVGPVEEEERT